MYVIMKSFVGNFNFRERTFLDELSFCNRRFIKNAFLLAQLHFPDFSIDRLLRCCPREGQTSIVKTSKFSKVDVECVLLK